MNEVLKCHMIWTCKQNDNIAVLFGFVNKIYTWGKEYSWFVIHKVPSPKVPLSCLYNINFFIHKIKI